MVLVAIGITSFKCSLNKQGFIDPERLQTTPGYSWKWALDPNESLKEICSVRDFTTLAMVKLYVLMCQEVWKKTIKKKDRFLLKHVFVWAREPSLRFFWCCGALVIRADPTHLQSSCFLDCPCSKVNCVQEFSTFARDTYLCKKDHEDDCHLELRVVGWLGSVSPREDKKKWPFEKRLKGFPRSYEFFHMRKLYCRYIHPGSYHRSSTTV